MEQHSFIHTPYMRTYERSLAFIKFPVTPKQMIRKLILTIFYLTISLSLSESKGALYLFRMLKSVIQRKTGERTSSPIQPQRAEAFLTSVLITVKYQAIESQTSTSNVQCSIVTYKVFFKTAPLLCKACVVSS